MARHLVIQGLEDARSDKMKDEFTAMRDGLADFYFALLIMKFGMSEEQANDLVKETLLRRREA
jgi:hypothetical protein